MDAPQYVLLKRAALRGSAKVSIIVKSRGHRPAETVLFKLLRDDFFKLASGADRFPDHRFRPDNAWRSLEGGEIPCLFVDPIERDLLFTLATSDSHKLYAADIWLLRNALKRDHLVGAAGNSRFDGGFTGKEGFLNVVAGSAVRGAALKQRKLDAADLCAGLFLDDVCQHRGKSAELSMSEAVGRGGGRFGNEAAVGVMDAFGNGYDAVAVFVVDAGGIGQEFVHIENDLGQIDEVGSGAHFGGERGGGGEPSGVTAHNLDDGDHAGVVHAGVLIDLHYRGGDVFRGGGKAGAVVGPEKIVIDRLRNAHTRHSQPDFSIYFEILLQVSIESFPPL